MTETDTDGEADSLVEVCPVDELSPGERRVVEIDSNEVGIFNVDEEFYALGNRCLHRGGPVCEGQVQSEIVADWPGPGQRTDERVSNTPTVACPWHGWEYNLDTGDHIGDDEYSLSTYDVVIHNGMLYIKR